MFKIMIFILSWCLTFGSIAHADLTPSVESRLNGESAQLSPRLRETIEGIILKKKSQILEREILEHQFSEEMLELLDKKTLYKLFNVATAAGALFVLKDGSQRARALRSRMPQVLEYYWSNPQAERPFKYVPLKRTQVVMRLLPFIAAFAGVTALFLSNSSKHSKIKSQITEIASDIETINELNRRDQNVIDELGAMLSVTVND